MTENPIDATAVERTVTRAATEHRLGHGDNARRLTHDACALVAEADSPHVYRGQTLTELVAIYGDGLGAA